VFWKRYILAGQMSLDNQGLNQSNKRLRIIKHANGMIHRLDRKASAEAG
jgi:hypothetical protein